MSIYYDYLYRFPLASLALAADAFTALRALGVLPPDGLPENMLGDAILLNGAEVARGRQGRAAIERTDPDTGATETIPAAGDPAYIYVNIRTRLAPADLPPGFSPRAYALEETTAAESAAVLGVWA